MRYVGDMLAWVHQAVAAEQEFLEALFGMQNQRRMVGSVRTFDGKTEEEEWVNELMNSCVAKLCLPLKVGSHHLKTILMRPLRIIRLESSKRYGVKRAVLFHIR